MKKFLAILFILSHLLLCSLLLMGCAKKEESPLGFIYTIDETNNTALIVDYKAGETFNDGVLTIPSRLDDYSVSGIKAYAFSHQSSLKEIIIECERDYTLESYAFSYCSNLQKATLKNNSNQSVILTLGSTGLPTKSLTDLTLENIDVSLNNGSDIKGLERINLYNATFCFNDFNGCDTLTLSGSSNFYVLDQNKKQKHYIINTVNILGDFNSLDSILMNADIKKVSDQYEAIYYPLAKYINLPANIKDVPSGLIGDVTDSNYAYTVNYPDEDITLLTLNNHNSNLSEQRINTKTLYDTFVRVSFNSIGSKVEDKEILYGSVLDNSIISTKENMVFDGWYYDEELTLPYQDEEIKSDTLFYASFLTESAYHVKYQTAHVYDDGIVLIEPTCTSLGSKELTCTLCGEQSTIAIPMTSHSEKEVMDKEPTCLEGGQKHYECENCHALLRTESLRALGHDYVSVKTQEENCTEEGIITTTCSRCHDQSTEIVKALGHAWNQGVTLNETTCTQEGTIKYTCSRCLVERVESKAPYGHNYQVIKDTLPTCTEIGEHIEECSRCHDQIKTKTPVLGHLPKDMVIENYVKATCTEDGSYEGVIYCERCGQEVIRYVPTIIPKTGHKFIETTIEATVTTPLIHRSECQNCGLIIDTPEGEALGDGTKEYPYPIQSIADFKKMETYPSSCFKLCCDLDFTNSEKINITEFSGTLDGCYHTLSHYSSDKPLFTKNSGTITNLICDNFTIKKDIAFGELRLGGLVVTNTGAITNVEMLNSVIYAEVKNAVWGANGVYQVDTENYCIAGGIAANNEYVIEHVLVSNTQVTAKMAETVKSNTAEIASVIGNKTCNRYAIAGGIAALVENICDIRYSYVKDCAIEASCTGIAGCYAKDFQKDQHCTGTISALVGTAFGSYTYDVNNYTVYTLSLNNTLKTSTDVVCYRGKSGILNNCCDEATVKSFCGSNQSMVQFSTFNKDTIHLREDYVLDNVEDYTSKIQASSLSIFKTHGLTITSNDINFDFTFNKN